MPRTETLYGELSASADKCHANSSLGRGMNKKMKTIHFSCHIRDVTAPECDYFRPSDLENLNIKR